MTNILFLCCAYSETQQASFLKESKRGYQYAAQNFQFSLIDGFLKNPSATLNVLSIPSLSTYPKGCGIVKVKDCPFVFEDKIIGESYGFFNIPFFNHKYQSRVDKYIDGWYAASSDTKTIIVYAMLKQQMLYAVEAKRRHPDIRLCLIIPDLPMYMACNKYYKLLGMQKHDMKVIESLLHLFDYYVVLAEPMVNKLRIQDKPHAVIEGIYSEMKSSSEKNPKFAKKTIMYAGGIVSRYGVFDLIEAFHRIKNEEVRLLLCGPCPEMEKLNDYLNSDKRIEYRGLVSTTEVRRLQKQVTLLVNPRHSTEDFTKYSFPSKTLEYMASGTPVLMSNLPSMPNEYKGYLYLFDDETIDGMRSRIEEVLSFDIHLLSIKGGQAKDYILKFKNSRSQTRKIIDLIEK